MKKKILSLGFCSILVWGALVLWNWAPVFAESLDCSHLWFDCLSAGFGIAALAFACNASERKTTSDYGTED